MGGSATSGLSTGILSRRLVLSSRLRTFKVDGRIFAHASQVPLTYLAASPGLMDVLRQFSTPGQLQTALGSGATSDDEEFFSMLHRVGILLDADTPDSVHAMMPNHSLVSSLLLYPTNACNLRCVYCHATSGPNAGPKLSRDHACAAIDRFFHSLDPQVRAVVLRFHGGGEPTTNFPVMAVAWEHFSQHAAKRNLAASAQTITNGVFGKEVLHALQAPQWHVTVSYDGLRQGVQRPSADHRDMRKRVVANLRALHDSGKILTTRATVTRAGLASLHDLVDDANEIGISRVQVEPASSLGRGADLLDGPPDPLTFAVSFLDAFRYALGSGVALGTSAWSHARVGDGRYCAAIAGTRALTPDGFLSACTEVCDGRVATNPFIVGTQQPNQPIDIWPAREAALQRRVGYHMEHCRDCFMVDTCAGGCASNRALKIPATQVIHLV